MKIPFVKMQAQGNDFVVVDRLSNTGAVPYLNKAFVRKLCDRHFGVGCDQLLLLMPHAQADALMLIFNADGSEAANCGNGLRCVADYLMRKLKRTAVSIALADRVLSATATAHGIAVLMGKATVEDRAEHYTDVSLGNAHRVFFMQPKLCPERNVEIISSYDAAQASIRIIERGAGETLACGSGACATAVAVWQKLGRCEPLTIHMPGGDVVVSMKHKALYLEGQVTLVYEGSYMHSC